MCGSASPAAGDDRRGCCLRIALHPNGAGSRATLRVNSLSALRGCARSARKIFNKARCAALVAALPRGRALAFTAISPAILGLVRACGGARGLVTSSLAINAAGAAEIISSLSAVMGRLSSAWRGGWRYLWRVYGVLVGQWEKSL